jgi:SAM-dependent MidA family methyltransferase
MMNSSKYASLPVPGPVALAHSQTLEAQIAAAIEAGGGWLPFDRYMELTLYTPGLGYYSGGSTKFGWRAEDGSDFITAPELSPFFAQTVGNAVSEALLASGTRAVMEFGAGTGKLAAGIIARLDTLGTPCERYTIVELSGELRERQQATLAAACSGHPEWLAKVNWLDALPDRFDGVMLGNEVLDAMPVKLYQRRAGVWHERGVTLTAFDATATSAEVATTSVKATSTSVKVSITPTKVAITSVEAAITPVDADATLAPATTLRLGWADRPGAAPDAQLAALFAEIEGDHDYLTETCDAAAAFTTTVLKLLGRGALLLIDYGFPRHEYLHPQRTGGTLMCHYRHRAHDNPFLYPGLQDITAHVDFTAIARAGLATGADLLGYTSQARFLINGGITDLLGQLDPQDIHHFLPAANAVQKLLAESEMGELFKVIGFGRGMADTLSAFARGDRSHAL